MIDPNKILISESVSVTKKQNVIGLISNSRVYFTQVSVGNDISSRNDERTGMVRDFFVNTCKNAIDLRMVLEMAGAIIEEEVPDFGLYVDLRPAALDKTTIIELFAPEQLSDEG